jgi:hypothetical protein
MLVTGARNTAKVRGGGGTICKAPGSHEGWRFVEVGPTMSEVGQWLCPPVGEQRNGHRVGGVDRVAEFLGRVGRPRGTEMKPSQGRQPDHPLHRSIILVYGRGATDRQFGWWW